MAPRTSRASARAVPGLPSKTFVLDNGAYSIKAGFAPGRSASDTEAVLNCHIIPNALVRTRDRKTYVGVESKEIAQWSEALFRRPVENGQVVSWEAQKDIWDQSFFDERTAHKDVFVKNPEETTLLFTEPPNALPAMQKNADEIIMEEWQFGGYTRMIGSSLNAYNDLHPLFEENWTPKSEPTADLPMECLLVIDSGYSHTTVTPLYNGRPLHRAIRRLDFAGKHFTNLLKEVISVRHFDLHQDTKIVNDIKEDVCFVSEDFKEDLERTWKGNKKRQAALPSKKEGHEMDLDQPSDVVQVDYVLPDGIHLLRGFSRPHDPSAAAKKRKQAALLHSNPLDAEVSMTLGNERFSIPEIIFSPSDIGSKQPGLADIVMQSMCVLPPLIQATMLSNILVVGGSAKIPGFNSRLEAELRSRFKTEWKIRVRSQNDPITSNWLGGARMASKSPEVVREYGVTREEYLDHGSAWTARRFLNGGSGKGS